MFAAAEKLELEKAARLRDQVRKLDPVCSRSRRDAATQLETEAPGLALEPGARGTPPRRKKTKRKLAR